MAHPVTWNVPAGEGRRKTRPGTATRSHGSTGDWRRPTARMPAGPRRCASPAGRPVAGVDKIVDTAAIRTAGTEPPAPARPRRPSRCGCSPAPARQMHGATVQAQLTRRLRGRSLSRNRRGIAPREIAHGSAVTGQTAEDRHVAVTTGGIDHGDKSCPDTPKHPMIAMRNRSLIVADDRRQVTRDNQPRGDFLRGSSRAEVAGRPAVSAPAARRPAASPPGLGATPPRR